MQNKQPSKLWQRLPSQMKGKIHHWDMKLAVNSPEATRALCAMLEYFQDKNVDLSNRDQPFTVNSRQDVLLFMGWAKRRMKNKGCQLLHRLAELDKTTLLKKLVLNRASISNIDEQGRLPLHLAIENGAINCTKFLLTVDKRKQQHRKSRPQLYCVDQQGHSPLDLLDENDQAMTVLIDRYRGTPPSRQENPQTILPHPNGEYAPNWVDSATQDDYYREVIEPTGQIVEWQNNHILFRYCSGGLISNDLFLTAGHCVNSTIQAHHKQTGSVHISFDYQYPYAGQFNGQGYGQIHEHVYPVVTLVEHGSIHGTDYAIYRLGTNPNEQLPGERYGYFNLTDRLPQVGDALVMAHHPKGQPKKISHGWAVSRPDNTGVFSHNMDSQGGSSGSPVVDDRTNALIGVHIAGSPMVNFAVSIDKIKEHSQTIQGLLKNSLFEKQNKDSHSHDNNHYHLQQLLAEQKTECGCGCGGKKNDDDDNNNNNLYSNSL